ncbi:MULTISPECIES: DUF86 domain-containing protein [Paenibacillus]|uniref:DUF86 domain-containing protein n=1 Tax=Paenibacillus TaxID=44249 RepID=UPI0022B8CF83|nr:HepT-like ribonuclease domain-containing protein [Paenibacillus caseinilyticus]MCZ8518115.1 DUF86 domain-containing protein [Paenibacillus caseinilyticus]
MYYVNHEQIDVRLAFIPALTKACRELEAAWAAEAAEPGLLLHLAQERTLILAIETVTDVGSLLIDAFMMRDASSYEDIVDILAGEGVIEASTAGVLRELVGLRRTLTQEYTSLERSGLHPMVPRLPQRLEAFAERVPAFIRKEVI